MKTFNNTAITVETKVRVPVEKAWACWTQPEHITKWCQASDDWHAPFAENDLRINGKFRTTMAARDGSSSFDFEGVYTRIEQHRLIEYTMSDGRKVSIVFHPDGNETKIEETFETEDLHTPDLQRDGWQAILDNFKKYCEQTGKLGKVHFETLINADAQRVYKIMLDKELYTKWTSVFAPGSYFVGSWEKGKKILFLAPAENGGMVSRIRENIPFRYVSIEHLGMVKDGEEITTGKEVEEWQGAMENYTFEEKNGKTLLSVDMDSNEEMQPYFNETWPKALAALKELCEATTE